METYGLRIKRIYFDQILSGEKTYEIRAVSPRYARLPQAKKIMLHYQHPRRLIADVVSVQIVSAKSVPGLAASGIDFGDKVYKVNLANPREYIHQT